MRHVEVGLPALIPQSPRQAKRGLCPGPPSVEGGVQGLLQSTTEDLRLTKVHSPTSARTGAPRLPLRAHVRMFWRTPAPRGGSVRRETQVFAGVPWSAWGRAEQVPRRVVAGTQPVRAPCDSAPGTAQARPHARPLACVGKSRAGTQASRVRTSWSQELSPGPGDSVEGSGRQRARHGPMVDRNHLGEAASPRGPLKCTLTTAAPSPSHRNQACSSSLNRYRAQNSAPALFFQPNPENADPFC